MKKFITALLALILALAMAFAMVACEETNKDPNNGNGNDTEQGGNNTGDNTGDNTGGNEEDESLQPVDAKTFAQSILNQIGKADGFSVTLKGTYTGTTTVGDAEPVDISNSSFTDQKYDLEKSYANNILTVFDELCGFINGFDEFYGRIMNSDGFIDDIFAGTVKPENNSGYKYTFSVNTEKFKSVLDKVNTYFQGAGKEQSVFAAMAPLLETSSGEPATEEDVQAWFTDLFAADKTVKEFLVKFNDLLPAGMHIQDIIGIAAGIMEMPALNFDAIMAMKIAIIVNADGSIGIGASDKALGETTMSELINPVLAALLPSEDGSASITYETLGLLIPALIGGQTMTNFYDWVCSLIQTFANVSLPTSTELNEAVLTAATLSVTLVTDKDMKLTSFTANITFDGSITIGGVLYSADNITAKLEGIFGYEATAAGDAGSEAIAA